ncbi:MAG: hypothetical protein KKG33_09250 [candidate division Zixibacteria bacterium]|nr:hypothetical protein [candidate division Zixibacteria bacterium]
MYLSAEGPSLVDLRDTREISSADSIRLGYGSAGEGEDRRNRTNGSASLALDFNRNKLHIKMGNVLLRDCDMQVLSDSAAAAALLKAWQKADSPDRVISRVHLFSAVPVLPQAGLNAISETFGMSEKLVQRYIPENMMIETAGDVSIWIITDAAGESLSTLGNIIEHVHLIWERLTGMKSVRIHLAESDAMSVFGLCLNHPKLIIEG